MKTHEKQYGWLTGLLTGWGIRESWAKLIAGAVIGALAAAGLLTSCESITPEQIERWHKAAHLLIGEDGYRVIPMENVKK